VRRLLLIGGAAALALAGSAYAAFFSQTTTPSNSFTANSAFCVSPGPGAAVTADADSYVDLFTPTTNFGGASSIFVNSNGAKTQRVYVHFALPTPPHNCSVTAATLRLNASAATAGRTLNASQAAASWTENVITWNNQPGPTGSAASVASGTGWLSWSVTSEVQAMYSGTNTGFMIADSIESGGNKLQTFNSREAASNKPDLTITWG